MSNKSINELLLEIKQDRHALHIATQAYKEKMTKRLTSPLGLAAVFLGSVFAAKSIFSKKKVIRQEPVVSDKGFLASHIPEMLFTLASALLPKLLWDFYKKH